jgi:hypothetical protein
LAYPFIKEFILNRDDKVEYIGLSYKHTVIYKEKVNKINVSKCSTQDYLTE